MNAAIKFDSAKPHGVISGDDSAKPRKFVQNGHYFCADGSLWTPPDPEPAAAVASEDEVQARIDKAVAEAVAKASQNTDKVVAAAIAAALGAQAQQAAKAAGK